MLHPLLPLSSLLFPVLLVLLPLLMLPMLMLPMLMLPMISTARGAGRRRCATWRSWTQSIQITNEINLAKKALVLIVVSLLCAFLINFFAEPLS